MTFSVVSIPKLKPIIMVGKCGAGKQLSLEWAERQGRKQVPTGLCLPGFLPLSEQQQALSISCWAHNKNIPLSAFQSLKECQFLSIFFKYCTSYNLQRNSWFYIQCHKVLPNTPLFLNVILYILLFKMNLLHVTFLLFSFNPVFL